MQRSVGYLSLLVALASAAVAWALRRLPVLPVAETTASIVSQVLLVASVVAGGNGLYLLVSRYVVDHTVSKRRGHDALNLLRFVFVAMTILGVLAVLTGQWVGLLFSLGVVRFVITFALQQPLFSLIGEEMAERIQTYRKRLAETPVELEVRDGLTVNVIQKESWVELRLRYLVHPRRGQRVRNELHTRILERFNADPDRVKFPVSRNR